MLVAKGFEGDRFVTSDTLSLNYYFKKYEKPHHFQLTYRRLPNGHYLIEAVLVDKTGRRVLDYNKRIYFSLDGEGHLLKDYGTPTRSEIIEMANGYAAIEMVAVPGEKAVIEVRNQDFKGDYLILGK